MGASKTDQFTESQNELALIAKALGHPARIAIMQYLAQAQSCICGDIVNELPLAQATVSQHLRELKNAGLIKGSIEGTAICYCIDEERLEKMLHSFQELIQISKNKNGNCC